MMTIVVVEITTVDAPPLSWSLTCCAALPAFSRSAPDSVSIAASALVEVKAELGRDRLDLGALERLADSRAIGVLFRCAVGDGRRELAGRDDVLLPRERRRRSDQESDEREDEQGAN